MLGEVASRAESWPGIPALPPTHRHPVIERLPAVEDDIHIAAYIPLLVEKSGASDKSRIPTNAKSLRELSGQHVSNQSRATSQESG
jgi:hypothetical protein